MGGGVVKCWIHRSNGITCRGLVVGVGEMGQDTRERGGSKMKTRWKLSTGDGGWGFTVRISWSVVEETTWHDQDVFNARGGEKCGRERKKSKSGRGRPCVKADVRRVQRNRQVWSHLMGKGNIYEAGSDTHRATRCGPVTDPSKSHKTNKRHDGEMKSLLTDATSRPFGTKTVHSCLSIKPHCIKRVCRKTISFFFTQQTRASLYSLHSLHEIRPSLQPRIQLPTSWDIMTGQHVSSVSHSFPFFCHLRFHNPPPPSYFTVHEAIKWHIKQSISFHTQLCRHKNWISLTTGTLVKPSSDQL